VPLRMSSWTEPRKTQYVRLKSLIFTDGHDGEKRDQGTYFAWIPFLICGYFARAGPGPRLTDIGHIIAKGPDCIEDTHRSAAKIHRYRKSYAVAYSRALQPAGRTCRVCKRQTHRRLSRQESGRMVPKNMCPL
jgi:hypothetical protein